MIKIIQASTIHTDDAMCASARVAIRTIMNRCDERESRATPRALADTYAPEGPAWPGSAWVSTTKSSSPAPPLPRYIS